MKPGWFGPKRFGIGIGPRSWEGWLVTLASFLLILFARLLPLPAGWVLGLRIGVVVLMLAIVALTYRGDDGQKT